MQDLTQINIMIDNVINQRDNFVPVTSIKGLKAGKKLQIIKRVNPE